MKKIILHLILLLWYGISTASETGYKGRFFMADCNTLSAADILSALDKYPFKDLTPADFNVGFSDKDLWVLLDFDSSALVDKKHFLEIENPFTDTVELFWQNPQNGTIHMERAGSVVPYSQKESKTGHPSFIITPEKICKPVLLRLYSTSMANFPIRYFEQEEFYQKESMLFLFTGIFIGIGLLFLFYNAMVWFQTREVLYLLNITYIIIMLFLGSIFRGLAFQHFWPESPRFNYYSVVFWVWCLEIISLVITIYILKLKTLLPGFYKAFLGIMVLVTLDLLFLFITDRRPIIILQNLFSLFCFVAIITSYLSWRKGNKAAKYFIWGWSVYSFFIMLYVIKDFGVLPVNYLTENSNYLATLFEIGFFSIAINHYITQTKHENKELKEMLVKYEEELNILRKSLMEAENDQSIVPTKALAGVEINTMLNDRLSKREVEVLNKLLEGKSNQQVADEIFVSVNTVKKHIKSIYSKLDVSNRAQVSKKALDMGLVGQN